MAKTTDHSTVEKTLLQTASNRTMVLSTQPLAAADMEKDVNIDTTDPFGKDNNMPEVVSAGEVLFILKGQQYKAIRSISESSGEAQIVLVECDGKQYCLKLYYPNYHFKDDILNAVWNIDLDMVVRLFDYGHTVVNGVERDYELMEYLEGGTLSQYHLNEDMRMFRIIALQAAAALEAIHTFGIIHKDIKPGNYFFRDAEHTQLVLGDFGISAMQKDGDEVLRTSQARTPAFAAPEMYDDVIDGEVEIDCRADFYSLGITLLYLWLGKSPFGKNERLMMRLKQEGRLPHVADLPERVAMIIKGLTSINPQRRWGFDEVERWFKGEDVPIDTSSVYLRYKSFVVDPERNLIAHDIKELVPLLYENQQLGVHYLYSHRLESWLDECGNSKMAVLLNEIVEHRYQSCQSAGLMAALYLMEPNFPYYDINGQACNSLQEISLALLNNAQEYQYRLQDENDILFVYLDAHYQYDIAQLKSYFQPADKSSVLKLAFEIDTSLPFLPSVNNVEELVKAFASPARTEAEWASLSDGTLLAWLHGRVDATLCEAVRFISIHSKADVRTKGYQILYNIDRSSAFDLKQVNTVPGVAALMADKLLQCQTLSETEFAEQMADYVTLGGRLEIYAQVHQWVKTLDSIHGILDLRAPHNTERYSIYDLRTAAYKMCKAMGGTPLYQFVVDDQIINVAHPDELQDLPVKQVRQAIRNEHLIQWISIFYHEDPTADFEDDMAYNQCVQDFLQLIGSYDGGEIHYKRFVIAQEEMERKVRESRQAWDQSIKSKNIFRFAFVGVNLLWIVLLAVFGLNLTENMRAHIYLYTVLSVGFPFGIKLAVRNYFRGNGVSLGILNMLGGMLLALIPAAVLSLCINNFAPATRWVALAMSVAYLCVGLKYAFGASTVAGSLDELKGAFRVNEDEVLNEMLYYTFRSRTFKFKGSTFAVMDEAVGEARSSSTEKIINCVMWSLVPIFLILAMFWFHDQMLDHNGPDTASWKQAWFDFWVQFKALFR